MNRCRFNRTKVPQVFGPRATLDSIAAAATAKFGGSGNVEIARRQ